MLEWIAAIPGEHVFLKHFCQHYGCNAYPSRGMLRKQLGAAAPGKRWKWRKDDPIIKRVDKCFKEWTGGKHATT